MCCALFEKGNTHSMMAKKWLCEILHIAGLLNYENPVQIQLEKYLLNIYCCEGEGNQLPKTLQSKGIPTQAQISSWVKVWHKI